MPEVSPCCGCGYEDSFITDCCTAEIYTGSDVCSSCEREADCSGYICNECGNWFEQLEERREWYARIKENAAEERADARRKYGE
jgi:hypothetical protein